MRTAPVVAILVAVASTGCLQLDPSPGRTAWAYAATGLDALGDRGLDGSGVRVAIVDTGIDGDHPALRGANVVAWLDVTDGRPDPYDPVGHGTHVAGIVAAQGRLRGGAPGVDLIVAKVFDQEGRSDDLTVARGIDFAVEQGADVIGLSLGGGTFPLLGTATEDAARAAIRRGIVVVAAAGNEGPGNADVSSPAMVAGVIAVAAADRDREVADFSSRGSRSAGLLGPLGPARTAPDEKPEVSAPGVDIAGAWQRGRYATASGTSQAVPFVVSALALILQDRPAADPQDAAGVERLKDALMRTAAPMPGAQRPHDVAAGYGFLDAVAWRDAVAA